jgi:uncharacterized protein (TIGR01777 family)
MTIVLITGGSGLIGRALSQKLLNQNYEVRHLSRTPKRALPEIPTYVWNVDKQQIDQQALEGVNYLIHLAGASINHRWTKKYKKLIRDSRVKGTQLLVDTLSSIDHNIKSAVCASGANYYGHQGDKWLTEDHPPANDFLGETCQEWEGALQQFNSQGIRTVILRTGVVLSLQGGALPSMAKPIKFYVGAPLGSGQQYMPWIHIEDLCRMYLKAMEDPNMKGPYNAVAPHPVTNEEMTKTLGQVLNRPVFLPNVPQFVLKLMFGEMSQLLFDSVRPSTKKIQTTGFQFKYPKLKEALTAIYS